MAIQLVTGLPGNAKTLFSIQFIIDWAKRENRAVYYSGLKDFKADDPRLQGTEWNEFDPLTWHETVPSGAICLIDEAQKIFRARSLGSIPPKHVTELEEHRHKGLDFVMITQHPSLVDPAIRRLTQIHRHMMRIFGMEASTVHQWADGCKDHPDKSSTRASSEKTRWVFAKHLYGLYKSADVHTVKRQIPWRVKLLGLLLVVFVACVWYVSSLLHKKSSPLSSVAEASKVVSADQFASKNTNTTQAVTPSRSSDPMADLKDYVWQNTPRVVGLPQTAPKYDALTAPVRVPVPAACIMRGDVVHGEKVQCKCYTQQGTPMQVQLNMCVEFARNGFFQDFDPDPARRDAARSDRSVAVLSDRPDAPVPVRQVQAGPSVSVLPGVSMGPQRTDRSPGLNEAGEIQDGSPNNRATRAAGGAGV